MGRCLCISIGLLLTAANAFGQLPIEDPGYSVGARVSAAEFSFTDSEGTLGASGTATVIEEVEFPNGEIVGGYAQAETKGAPAPYLTLEAGILRSIVPPLAIPTTVVAEAGATLNYRFRIIEVATPPANPITIPIKMDYHLVAHAVNVSNAAGFNMWASVSVSRLLSTGPDFLFMDRIDLVAGSGITFVESPDLNMPANSSDPFPIIMASRFVDHEVTMMGSAAVAASGSNQSEEIVVEIDPVISFHQPSFDEMRGDNTFNLADFYSFEFSPGISNVRVPEPSSVVIVIFVALICYLRGRRV